ncbi:uncharacterized protein AB675_9522 [Cyphellophora attinorum]|uniref:Azaphilone pigments biosynthesis cluster protein L N-terminal domain-containing protein n=1 Tax=Cyphellophora attinorum TaxID=1664694 RepID=A0A0N0NP78_9EURO|nr:uncharacterized protein AB675_9522 [Phialophora attinorum]KPI42408.1 hypothetical protein AB675_9522 [Phialophora attinorum]
MPEPLTIVTSCFGLLGSIVNISKELTSFVSKAREARKDIDGFLRELQSLKLCVETLKDEQFPFPESHQKQLITMLYHCDIIVREMANIIQTKQSYHDPSQSNNIASSSPTFVGKIKWSFKDRDQVTSLRGRLEAHKTTLDIVLDMAIITTTAQIKDDTGMLRETTTLIKEDTGSIREDASKLRQEVEKLRKQLAALSSDRPSEPPMLQRFLEETFTYTESVLGASGDAPDADHPSDEVKSFESNADTICAPNEVQDPDDSASAHIGSQSRIRPTTGHHIISVDPPPTRANEVAQTASNSPKGREEELLEAIWHHSAADCERLLRQRVKFDARANVHKILSTKPDCSKEHIAVLRILATYNHRPEYSKAIVQYAALATNERPYEFDVVEYLASCGADVKAKLDQDTVKALCELSERSWATLRIAQNDSNLEFVARYRTGVGWIPRLIALDRTIVADINQNFSVRLQLLLTPIWSDNVPAITELISRGISVAWPMAFELYVAAVRTTARWLTLDNRLWEKWKDRHIGNDRRDHAEELARRHGLEIKTTRQGGSNDGEELVLRCKAHQVLLYAYGDEVLRALLSGQWQRPAGAEQFSDPGETLVYERLEALSSGNSKAVSPPLLEWFYAPPPVSAPCPKLERPSQAQTKSQVTEPTRPITYLTTTSCTYRSAKPWSRNRL